MRVDSVRRNHAWLIAIHILCFWPVWRWYATRLTDGSDEPFGVVAIAAALGATWFSRAASRPNSPQAIDDASLLAAAGWTALYAISLPWLPPLVRAAMAMIALACSWTGWTRTQAKLPAVIALLALSLPIISSLQFYAGFALRAITATGTAAALNLAGMQVERAGAALLWQGQTILVDAPCSGIRALWAGAALSSFLALQQSSVGWLSLLVRLAWVAPIAIVGNIVRAVLLFILETHANRSPMWHAAVGLATYAFVAAALLAIDNRMRLERREPESLHAA